MPQRFYSTLKRERGVSIHCDGGCGLKYVQSNLKTKIINRQNRSVIQRRNRTGKPNLSEFFEQENQIFFFFLSLDGPGCC